MNNWGLMNKKASYGKDQGGTGLGKKDNYQDCIVAEYVWVDAHNVPRSKTKTLTHRPTTCDDLPIWNFDGSSTEQAPGDDSEILLVPRAIFNDPFRCGDHIMVLAECYTPDMTPAIGNNRAKCSETMQKYDSLDSW